MNAVKTTVLWKNTENTSLEYFALQLLETGFTFSGTVIMLLEDSPTKVTYRISGDNSWRAKSVDISQEHDGKNSQLSLTIDDNQYWSANKKPVPFTTGLVDVDLEISPATNTLPIHRLNIPIGQSQTTDAVWVRFPSLTLERLKQRYTRIGERTYLYKAADLGFEAKLEIDQCKLITKYGELWKRIP